MSGPTLLVIADPKASFLARLNQVQDRVQVIISNDPARLKELVADADAILYANDKSGLMSEILPLAGRARWIHSLWTGVEHMTTAEMQAHPAPLTNGRGAFSRPLADWVLAVMLYFAFDLGRVVRQQQAGVWEQFVSTSLEGKTLGIVGYGALGSAAAWRARSFEMKIAALRRRPELFAANGHVDASYGPGQIDELMAVSDYLLVAAPLTTQTRGMIGQAQIAAMKSSAVVMNIGRGPVIDEAALIQALEAGRIRGAALDVFDTEPLPSGHPFYRLPNVLLSPHTADRVEGFLEPAFQCFFDNLDRFLKGEPLLNLVDKHAGY